MTSSSIHTTALPYRPNATGSQAPKARWLKVTVDGKQFAVGGSRVHFRGVTYGTFRPRADGHAFPNGTSSNGLRRHRAGRIQHGRTYTLPPDDVVELAADWGLRAARRRVLRRLAVRSSALRPASAEAWRATARRSCVRSPPARRQRAVLGIVLGNELPADVVRWVGTTAPSASSRAGGGRRCRGRHPTAQDLRELPDDRIPRDRRRSTFSRSTCTSRTGADLRRYLTKLHHLAGDRPLVLGEVGLHAGPARRRARRPTSRASSSRPPWNAASPAPALFSWTDEWWVGDAGGRRLALRPHAGRPLAETRARGSPRTCEPSHGRGPRRATGRRSRRRLRLQRGGDARRVPPPHLRARLSGPRGDRRRRRIHRRDRGHRRCTRTCELHSSSARRAVAGRATSASPALAASWSPYLDTDAYPTPEWPYYLALGSTAGRPEGRRPERSRPSAIRGRARRGAVARAVRCTCSPPTTAPSTCPVATWRSGRAVLEVGGFDPVYTSAGDDVDMCWKVLDPGREIGFHPAAGRCVAPPPPGRVGAYLRQQRGYGRARHWSGSAPEPVHRLGRDRAGWARSTPRACRHSRASA